MRVEARLDGEKEKKSSGTALVLSSASESAWTFSLSFFSPFPYSFFVSA